jgi:hypothetical protein
MTIFKGATFEKTNFQYEKMTIISAIINLKMALGRITL